MTYFVEIVETSSGTVVKRMGPIESERRAERILGGANINLNHERFYVRIVEEP